LARPFDAVLLVAFGGPLGPADVRPFLANVLRGRRVSPERIDEVAYHYDLFGGVSPITELTRRQAEALESRLAREGPPLPVYVGMRNWHPFLADALAEMARAGVGRAIGFIAAPHRSYSSCLQYRENVRDARAAVRSACGRQIEIVYAGDWHTHDRFIETMARHAEIAIGTLPPALRPAARIVFTAHSIPVAMAEAYPYREQLVASCRLVADRLRRGDWALAYQSRSGRPQDPWLEPDVRDSLRAARSEGIPAVVLCPIGFVSDHVEVLYDLDREASAVGREIGLSMARAETANDDPVFIEMMANVVRRTWRQYEGGRPIQIGF
jgi:ferrochelatase